MSVSSEQDVPPLRERVDSLLAENAHLQGRNAELLTLVAELRTTIDRLQARIDKLLKMKFGKSSERLLGPTLFDDDTEPTPAAEPIPEPAVEMVPKRKGHGRKPIPRDLPRQREILDLSEAEKCCPCCTKTRQRMGEDVSERLDFRPASIFVREIVRPTYVCRHCEQSARNPQIVQAALPVEPIPKSGIGAGLLSQIVVSKYIDHLPLYRQIPIYARHGWPVSSARLCDLIARCAQILEPLYWAMAQRVRCSFVIHADDTPVKLLRPERSAYAWLYLGDPQNPYTVFDITPGRSEDHPARFLAGYTGYIQADAYSGYNIIHESIRHLGCWAHVRRNFVDALQAFPDEASRALAWIRTLYAIERDIRDKKMSAEETVAFRRARAGPILKKFRAWIDEIYPKSLPKSRLGQALTYIHNQWPTLVRYLNDARFAIDNNVAERAVRPLAVGRKNWLFIGGDGGLLTASVLMSVCASAKQHNLNPWAYLTDVLTELANKPSDVKHLLPDVWAKRHAMDSDSSARS